MNFVLTGFKALGRQFRKMWDCLSLFRERRHLRIYETNLGELGWQQVDFYGDPEEQVKYIRRFEEMQANLLNRSAIISQEIVFLDKKREKMQGEFLEKENRLKNADSNLSETLQKNLEALQREERKIEKRYRNLLKTNLCTVQARVEMIQTSDRRRNIRKEIQEILLIRAKHDLTNSAKKAAIEMASQEIEIRHLLAQVHSLEREKKRIAREIQQMDREKENHFLILGRNLADNEIAPLNQPDVLKQVVASRQRIVSLRENIERSKIEFELIDKKELLKFCVFMGLLLLAAGYSLVRVLT